MNSVLAPIITFVAKRLKSKTYAAASIGILITALEVNYELISLLVPEGYRALTIALWPILMLVMREATTEALSSK